jgi:hypothetical protein
VPALISLRTSEHVLEAAPSLTLPRIAGEGISENGLSAAAPDERIAPGPIAFPAFISTLIL